jgi:hypothetical protein
MPTFLKRVFYLSPFLLAASALFALPEGGEVAAGQADFHSDGSSLKITTSDKAIVNYQKFNIGEKEHVQFIQPSVKSSVLNRVTGKDPSKILGKLSGNGRVFLVNPSGIYFGPNASVNTGSFLASTLNIRDEDFLNDKFHFFQESDSEKARIVNEGMIAASPEGFVALFAPFIENSGSILARAGKIILAAAERVTLDFSGDGLIQFTVDGDLKQALIENYGQIEAAGGSVEISLRTARDAIKMVVNTDGITPATAIEESNGVIRLVSTSLITANKIRVEGGDGSKIDVRGAIDASNSNVGEKGGSVHLLGDDIRLTGAEIDASGDSGGGIVLIGGNYQGQGDTHTAQTTIVDDSSLIYADAYLDGDGGEVIVWADDIARFDGKIYARGGAAGGDGGFVETSGKKTLIVQEGYVNALAPNGKVGDWLLDPLSIIVASAGAGTLVQAANCGDVATALTIPASTINAAAANVLLCASTTISQTTAVNITTSGVGIEYRAGTTTTLSTNTTTNNGAIQFTGAGASLLLGANIILTSAGGNVSFNGTINSSGAARTLNVNAAAGSISITGDIGTALALSTLTLTGNAGITLANIGTSSTAGSAGTTLSASAGAINFNGTNYFTSNSQSYTSAAGQNLKVNAGTNTTFKLTNAASTIAFNTGTIKLSAGSNFIASTTTGNLTIGALEPTGAETVSLSTTSGNIALGAIGAITRIGALTLSSTLGGAAVTGNGNITAASINRTSIAPTTFNGSLNTNGAAGINITGSTVILNAPVTASGSGSITISNTSTMTIASGANISLTGTGSFSQSGGGNITLGANIQTTNGSIGTGASSTVSVAEAAALTISTQLAAGGGDITIQGNLVGTTGGVAEKITLNAGTGTINVQNLGNGVATGLTDITITNSGILNINGVVNFTGALTQTNPATGATTFGSTINVGSAVLKGTSFTFNTSLASVGAISITNSGTVTHVAGNVTAPGGYSTSGDVALSNNITTTNQLLSIGGNLTIRSGSSSLLSTQGAAGAGNITITGNTNGTTGGVAETLALNSGTGTINLGGIFGAGGVSDSTGLTDVTITNSGTLNFNGAIAITGALKQTNAATGTTTFSNPVSVGSASLKGVAFAINNSLTSTGAIDVTNSGTLTKNSTGNITTAGGFSTTGAMSLSSNITTTNTALSIGGTLTIAQGITPTLSTQGAPGAGAITITGSTNGTTGGASETLTLNSGTGALNVGGLFGAGGVADATGLTTVTIINSGTTNFNGAIDITGAIVQTNAATGTTTFASTVSAGSATLRGVAFALNNSFTVISGGAISVTNSGTLSKNATGNITAPGGFSTSGTVNLAGNITTTNTALSIGGGVTVTQGASPTLTSGSGSLTIVGTTDGVTAGASEALTLDAAGGTINLGVMGTGNAAKLTTITITNSGTLNFNGAVNIIGALTQINPATGTTTFSSSVNVGSAVLSGTAFNINNSFASTGVISISNTGTATLSSAGAITAAGGFSTTGVLNIANNIITTGNTIGVGGALTLSGTSTLDTTNGGTAPAGANISFSSSIDGGGNLTLNAGTGGNILFTGAIGGITPVGAFGITSVQNVTFPAITAASIFQSAGSGTTTFNGIVNTSGLAGIVLTGTNFAINANMTTAPGSGGPISVTHSGTFSVASGVTISADGGFTDNGTGTVTLSGTITTNGQNISFSRPVTLVGDASLNTGSGVGNILFSSTLDGAHNLNLATGNGNITFMGTVGGTTPLGTMTITTANNVTANALSAAVFNQTAGTGISTFNGPVNLTGASGFSFVGANATFNSSVTTASGGPANIQISNNLILSSSAAFSLDGAFTQSGAGSDQLAGSITTTNDNISFAGPVILSGTTVLNTGAGIGDILFSSTIDGPGALTMTAGVGNISLNAAGGNFTRLGAITINSATNVSTLAISAASINQTVAATGTSTYSGGLNTNTAGGISLSSAVMTVNGNLITTNAGPVSLTHAGTLSLTAGSSTLIDSTFTESGTGGVTLSGTIATNNAAISFANAIVLTAPTSITSGAGAAGSITFSSTIDGGQNLTVSSGTGAIVFGGNVGGSTRLNNLTISLAGNVTANNISAATLTQLNGTGTTTLNGAVDTNAFGGVTLVGTAFTLNNTITTTAAGPLSIANSGLLNMTSGAVCSIDGAFTQSNVGATTLSGQITAGGAISFSGPITLSGNAVLSTTTSQNITLANTVDGGGNLTMTAGGGSIALQGAAGSGTRIGALTIVSALNVSTLGIVANSIAQQAGGGTTTINGDLNTNGPSGISFILNNLTLTGGLTTTNGGPVIETNSGTLTSVSTGTRTIDGFFLQNGTGPVIYAGTLQTNNQSISFSSPITLNGDVTLNSGSGGGNITLSGAVDGAYVLTLAAGTGDILLSGIIGGTTPLASMTFSTAHNITAQNAISANAIVQSAGSGTSIFNGALATSTVNGIALIGSAFQFNNTVTTSNAGVFSLSNSGTALFAANFTIHGTFTQSGAGGVSLAASLTTTGNNMTFGSPITLLSDSALSTGLAGSGILTLSSTVDGAHALSLTAGSGNIVISGAIGSSTALTSLTSSANNISLANIGTVGLAGVSGATNLTAASNLNFTGSTYHTGVQTYTAVVANITGVPLTTFISNGNNIDFSAAPLFIGTNANLTINSANGAITLNTVDAGINSGRTVTLNSGSGTITLANVGTLGNGEIAALNLTGGDILMHGNSFINAISIASVSPHVISLGGDITTTGSSITFPNNVNIIRDTVNNSTLTTNGGNITFQGKIDGDLPAMRSLTIAAGSGDVFFNNNIGDSVNLDALVITSAHNVTTAAVSVGEISQSTGTGTTTFGGQVTTSSVDGLTLVGTNFTFLSGVDTTTGNGDFSVNNSGTLTLNSGVIWNLGGALNQFGSGPVSLAVHIDSNNSIDFESPITLIGMTDLDTSAAGQNILLASTVDGGFDLSIETGTGNFVVGGAIGSINRVGALVVNSAANITIQSASASSIDLTWGSGTFAFTGALNTNALGGITLTGTNIFSTLGTITTTNGGPLSVSTSGTTSGTSGGPTVVSGSITQSSTGTGFIGGTFISLTGNITTVHNIHLTAPLIVDTSAGGGNILIQGTADGPFPLTFNAGTGNIDLQQAVGAATRLGAITINSAANVTTQAITAASITQLAGTGTTTFNGALNTNAASGISITTNSVVRGAAITTTNGGPCVIAISNAGTFTSTAAGAITVSGAFTQSGTGAVAFGGTISVSNNNISFAGPITLSADAFLDTGALAGNTVLSSTVQGAHALRISGGAGSVTLGGAVGTVLTPLTSVIIDNASNIIAQAITAGTIQQGAGTGTSIFNGALTTNTVTGIALIGTNFLFNAPFTTTALGPFTLTNSGLAMMSAAATGSVGAAFVQNGSGTTQLSNAITSTSSSIQFSGPVTLSTAASLMTTDQPITLLSTLDSSISTPGSLTVSSGTGDVTIGGDAGLLHPLLNLLISSARNVSVRAVRASSVVQSAGTGTTLFNDDLTTTGIGGVNLTGSAFTFSGNVTTSNSGPIAIVNSGVLSTAAGTTVFGDGGFSQTGAGVVNLGSNISANNNNISFFSPITLTGDVILNSGTTTGDITVGTVDGNFDLTFTAGRDIFAGVIGGGVRVGTVTATTVRNNNASAITAAAIVQLAGTGTTTLNGNIDTNTAAGINLIGTNFTRGGSIITTNSGSFVVTHTGLVTGTSINTTSIDGSYTANGVGPSAAHNLAGSITARSGITISSPITLLSDPGNLTPVILDTSGGNGNIVLSNTVNNDVNAAHRLILRAGAGDITLSGSIGALRPIGPLIFGNVNNITAAAIAADSIQQEIAATIASSAAFNGAITTSGSAGIVLSGSTIAFNNNVTTANNGPMAVTVSNQLTLANGITISLDGPFTQSGAGSTLLGGSIATTNDAISFASSVNLIGSGSLNTNSGPGDITLSSPINGAFPLTLTAGTGNVILQGSVGSALTAFTVNSAASILASSSITVAGPIALTTAGTLTFNSSVTTTAGGSIALANGGALTISSPIISASSLTQTQTGSPTTTLSANLTSNGALQLASNTTLTSNTTLNSGGGAIILGGTVDSDATARNLTLTPGTGSITLSSPLGGVNPLAAFLITNAANVTASDISAASIQQLTGTGLTHFTGTLATTTLGGVALTGSQFTLDNIVTTTNGGPLTIVHTGTLTMNALPALGAHSLSGFFSESGGGGVSTAANMTLSDQTVSFSDAVTLIGDTAITSGNSNITFLSSIDGPFCLVLSAGTGTIALDGPIGATTNLGCLTATGADILQNNSIISTGAVQETGAIILGGNITTAASNIILTGNVTLTTSGILSTGSGGGGGTIHITGSVNPDISTRNFTLQTGTAGTVTLDSGIGTLVPLHNFTVSSGTINFNNFGSTNVGATGTAALTAASNLNFTGTTYSNATQIYTAGGNFNFNAGAPTTIVSNGNPISFVTGTIQLSNLNDLSIDSNGGHVTLTDLFGVNRTLDISAALGTVTVAHIGTLAQPLNAIDVTAAILVAPFTTFPPINFTATVPTLIGVNQLDPTTYNSPVIITADNITFSFSTCPGGNNIIFNSTLDSDGIGNSRNIVFDMCGNTLTFNGTVGGTTPLTSITVNDDSGVNVNRGMTVGSYTENTSRVGATTTFASGLTTLSGAMNITAPNITLQGSIVIAGTATLNNSGTLLAPGVNFDVTGAFQQTGTGGSTISGTIDTSDTPISFHGPVTMNGNLALNTVNATGGNITFDNTVSGNFSLTSTAGTGDITLSGNLGTALNRLDDVIFVSSHNVNTQSIFAATITQLAGSGTFTVTGNLDTNDPSGINLKVTNMTYNGNVTTANGGNFVITNSGTITLTPGNTTSIDGSYIQNGAGGVNLAGTMTARNGISYSGAISLIGDAILDTSIGGGTITLSNTLDGAHSLTLKAGSGNVSLVSSVGGTSPLTSLILSDLHNFTSNAISAGSISQVGASTITGIVTFNGALSMAGAAGIVLAAPQFALNNNITTTGGGPLTLTQTGSLTFASGIVLSLSGPFSESGGGGVALAGTMTTANQNITFSDEVDLVSSTILTTGAGAGNITFSSTLDGAQSLDLTAGTGSITFGGSVGSSSTLGGLVIHSVNGITYPSVAAASINQMANSGLTTIDGPLMTTSLLGISLTGGAFTQNGTITTANLGGFVINHSATFAMAPGSGATISGSYTDSLLSTGAVSAQGTINAGGSIAFAGSGPITLAAATTLNSGASNGSITINGTIDGANDLTMNANGNSILLAADVGIGTQIGTLAISSVANFDAQKIRAGASFIQATGSGTSHFHDTVAINGAGGISLTGFNFTFDNTVTASSGPISISNVGLVIFNTGANVSAAGDFMLIGTGPVHLGNTITTTNGQIHLDSAITLTAATVMDSSAGNQPIRLEGLVDGAHALSLTSGSGSITALQSIGSVVPIGALSLSSTGTVLMEAISAASITQTGSAATTYSGDLNTTAGGGINLTTAAVSLLGEVTTTGAGPITLANSGLLTIAVGETLSGDGGFAQTGAGAVSLGGNILTSSAPISFVSPITLIADVILNSLSSGSGGSNITVTTVDGNFGLTFTAGAGDINAGDIGDITPLSALIVTSVHNNNAHDITAGTIQQFAGSGTTTLNGDLTSTSSAGITLVGTNFTRVGKIITLNGGNFVVTNSGLVTVTVINTTAIDGAYIQNGTGTTDFAGTITANQGISFLGPIVMVADGVFDTSAGNGPITLSNTIDNFDLITPHQLSINANTGAVVISSAIGASKPLSALKISGGSVSINNVGTALAAGLTGALQIPDPLTLVTPNQIIFTGTVVNAGAQTYTATTSFNMNAGAAMTIFSNAQPITFTTGTLRLAANTNLTINSVSGATGGNITTADIHAGANSLRALTLNAGNGIGAPGIVQPGTIGLAGNGEFISVSLTGILSLPNNISANSITFLPTGAMTVGGNLTTVNSNLTFPTAVTLTGSKTFSTSGGTISFTNTLDGDANDTRSLIMAAGGGDIIFGNAVGGTFRLNILTIASARNVTATAAGASVTVGSIIQASGTGTTEFSRSVSTRNPAGVQFNGNNLQFDSTSTLTTLNNGFMHISNTGTLTMAGTANLSGGLTQSGTGGVVLSGPIVSDQAVFFTAPVVATGTPSIDTSSNGQNITFSNTVNGPGALSLTAGTGDIAMNGIIGGSVPLGAVTIVSADDIDLAPLTASSLTFTTFTGTANYQSITTTGPAGVSFTGNNFIRNGTLIIGGGGSLTVTNSGFIRGFDTNTTLIDGSYIQNGTGPYELAGSITVGGDISFASAITLTGDASLTTAGNGTVTLSSTVDGNHNLTLAAGSGVIDLNGNIGNTDRIGALTINSAGDVTAQMINAASITQTAGSGTTTFSGDLNTNAPSGITLAGTHFVRSGNWTTTNSGPITITIPVSGSLLSTAVGTIDSAGAFQQLGLGSVFLSQTINTSNANILFSGPTTLAGTTTLNTSGSGAGDITFSNTLDGANDLILSSGSGNISMQSAVGGTVRLGSIAVNNADNVTFQSLTAAALSQLTGSGTTLLNGPTDIDTAAGISINAVGVTLGGTLTVTNSGVVTINNTGVFNIAANCSVDGDFTQVGSGSTILSGTVSSASGQIFFSGPVSTLGSTPQLTTFSQPISFNSTLDGPSLGTGNLTLDAGAAGDISFVDVIGATNRLGDMLISNARNVSMQAITAGSITQLAGTGTTSILGTIDTSNLIGIDLIGNVFTITASIITTNSGPMTIDHSGLLTLIAGPSTLIAGPFTESGTGTVSMAGNLHTNSADITFNNPITLLNPTTLNSDGSGDIILFSAVDGATDLTLDSGTNDITALVAIGGITPIDNLIIVNARNATFNVINAQTITQLAGTGTTTFNGAVTTSLFNGIHLTGNAFSFNAPVTTTGSGPVSIDNTGTLSIASAGAMNLTGPFSQIGTGSVALSGNITIDGDTILFTGPVTLGNTVALMTDTATGDVIFSNTLDGAQNLNIAVGVGAIIFSQAVGGSVALGTLTVTSAKDFTSQAITATAVNLSGISNLATFGTLTTTGALGIVLNGNAFTFSQDVSTTNLGPLTITNNGILTFSPTHSVTLDGAFNQNGSGQVLAAGTLVTHNQGVNFSAAVLLNGNYSINTGTTGATVTFGSDLDGPFNLNIAAGLGNVVFQKSIGDGNALQNFTITTAHDITLNGVGTTFDGVLGTLSLTASDLINLNNSFYTAGTQIYSAGTGVHFTNGAVTNLTSLGGPISFISGPITLSSGNDLSVATNNGAFSYVSIAGTTFENISINTGTGTAFMNLISGPHINNVFVHAGQIEFIGSIDAVNTDFESLGAIFNAGSPLAINSLNTATFNALSGDVGTLSSPILVNSSNEIFAGAGGRPDSLADFNGTSMDDTIHEIPSNPPCEIIFNDVIIKNCTIPPVPPVPTSNAGAKKIHRFPFAAPGFDSSSFNLASDYFFLPDFFDEKYVHRDVAMYYRAS